MGKKGLTFVLWGSNISVQIESLMVEARDSKSAVQKGPYSLTAQGDAAEVGTLCKMRFCWAVREHLPDCHIYVERYREIRPAIPYCFVVFYLDRLHR